MSMTQEEAIINIEKLIALYYTASEQNKMVDYSKIIETLEFAAVSLRTPTREQVDKVWRGGWIAVRESEITGFNPEFAGCDPIGGYKCSRCKAEAVLDCNDEFVLDNFCPRCGAAMTDEAVDMVMERLEALHGETKTD